MINDWPVGHYQLKLTFKKWIHFFSYCLFLLKIWIRGGIRILYCILYAICVSQHHGDLAYVSLAPIQKSTCLKRICQRAKCISIRDMWRHVTWHQTKLSTKAMASKQNKMKTMLNQLNVVGSTYIYLRYTGNASATKIKNQNWKSSNNALSCTLLWFEWRCHPVWAMFLVGGGWCADVQAMERCDSALS